MGSRSFNRDRNQGKLNKLFKEDRGKILKGPRDRKQITQLGNLFKQYLGEDYLATLDGVTTDSATKLVEKAAEAEKKTSDMEIAGAALERWLQQQARQEEIRASLAETGLKVMGQIEAAKNTQDTAVAKFLNEDTVRRLKADNALAFSTQQAQDQYAEASQSLSDKVRGLMQRRELKAANQQSAEALATQNENRKVLKAWLEGSLPTSRVLEVLPEIKKEPVNQGGTQATGIKGLLAPVVNALK